MSEMMATRRRLWLLSGTVVGLLAGPAWAANPKEASTSLDSRAFFRPDLYLSSSHVPLEEVLPQLPNREAWEAFLARNVARNGQARFHVFIDPRSGTATNIMGPVPLIPGGGVGNRVTLESLGRRLGREVKAVDAAVVAAAVVGYAREQQALLGIAPSQLGPARAVQVREDLWQVSIPQVVGGIAVRDARLVATLNSGNLVALGTQTWGNATIEPAMLERIKAGQAVEAGFAYAGGHEPGDLMVRQPRLEVVPFAPPEHQDGDAFAGPPGAGYGHRLVWTFAFQRPPDGALWEAMIDAGSGEVLAFQDVNQYAEQQVRGNTYPLTSTGTCPIPQQCGTVQFGSPMPFANTGLAAPNNFTNSAGIFDYISGTVTTTLAGRYVRINDTCGAISESAPGAIDLGGFPGQHDCTRSGISAGDTFASRSGFYELNKLIEQARGYLPGNAWLQSQLPANMNINQTCNAFWSPGAQNVNFYRSGGGCRNTGEIAAVFDHEWGHGMDDNDAAGILSNSSEAYADVAAIYRLQASCVGHGFFQTVDHGCGPTADGTGLNQNENQVGGSHCDLDCSGVRDADWDKHVDHTPDTAVGFVCTACVTGSGPCGRQVHCAAAPVRQSAWDLVTRDLTGPPFDLDSQSAFIVGNKLFYQGSGNVGLWHACVCSSSSSSGCGAGNGYVEWLAADDDNGNLNDGTPHMTAIHAAYNRHGIGCASPTPQNSGCSAGPSAPPATLTATPGNFQVALDWSAVPGATRYWVFRSEGHAGCNFGKALIAEVTTLTYTDRAVANGRTYYYNVVAAGSSPACYGRASSCVPATPNLIPPSDFTLACSPAGLTVPQGSTGTSTCTVTSSGGFAGAVSLDCAGLPSGVSCGYNPPAVTPPANGSAESTLTLSVDAAAAVGSVNIQARGTSGALVRTFGLNLTVTGTGTDLTAVFDAVLRAPRCVSVGRSCDSGAALLLGRNSRGPEPNQPNTIASACPDGNSGTFHADESNDGLKVSTVDGGNFAPGKAVRVEATVWAWTTPAADKLDLYYAADANSPAWTFLATLEPATAGAQALSATYILPAGALQAVRAQLRYQGSASPCTTGGFNDHDDLVFGVDSSTGPPDNIAAFDAVLQAPRCTGPGRSCDSGPALLLGRATLGPEPHQPNSLAGSCADGSGGAFHVDESLDGLRVSTVDGTALAAGKTVRIDAAVWAWTTPTADSLDLYYTADAANPNWTYITTITPGAAGLQKVTATYVLPVGANQAIRGRFRYQGSAAPCGAGSFDDHDDLVFSVP